MIDLPTAILFYSLCCLCMFVYAFIVHKDIFHPAALGSLLAFVAITGGWASVAVHDIEKLYPELDFSSHVLLYTISFVAFAIGSFIGSWGCRRASQTARHLTISDGYRLKIRRAAYVLGAIALLIYGLQLQAGGGFVQIYSQVKGKGDLGSGLNDFIYVCVPAATLYFLSLGQRRIGIIDVAIVLLMLSPLILGGILSSRRGPTAMALGALFFGYCIVRNYRPPIIVFLIACATGGTFIIGLVAFRGDIYLGSDVLNDLSVSSVSEAIGSFLSKPAPGHEFIYSSRVVQASSQDEDYWWGLRYLLATTIWLVPSFIFPDKYTVLGAEGMYYNGGTNGRMWLEGIDAPGAAPMMFADAYVEFGFFGPFFLVVLGWWLGRRWRAMISGNFVDAVLYVCALTVMIYLFSQNFTAFAQRFIVMSGTMLLVLSVGLPTRRRSPAFRSDPAYRISRNTASAVNAEHQSLK